MRGANLKPVPGGLNSIKPQKPRIWNNIAINKRTSEANTQLESRKPSPSTNYPLNQLPISAQFLNSWQQSNSDSRLSILYNLGPAGLNNIFTIDMPTALLGEIFEALLCFNPTSEVRAVIKLMEALTRIKRFNLIVHFLNTTEKAACQQLIQKLLASLVHQEQDLAEEGITEWTIQELSTRFLISKWDYDEWMHTLLWCPSDCLQKNTFKDLNMM